MAGENWTMWLNITNYALGIVTLIALLLVFFSVGWDLLVRKTAKSAARVDLSNISADLKALLHGSHSLTVPELGLTMADGGEKIEPPRPKVAKKNS